MSNPFTPCWLRRILGLYGLGIVVAASGWAAASYSSPYYISTLAGAASLGSKGSADGPGSKARFDGPYAVAVDGSGNVFVADNWNRTIRKITPAGVVSTFAGTPGVYGATDGPGRSALFANPVGIAVDATGYVYVVDTWSLTIRKITPEGVVSTLAGLAYNAGSADGVGSDARFGSLTSLTVDAAGMLYVVDAGNKTIRKITPAGVVTTLAGTPGRPGWNPLDGPMPSLDGQGAAARFLGPEGIGVDGSGNLYVTDEHAIRKITPTGVVTTFAGLAGSGNWGSADGLGSAARFTHPYGVATDRAGNVYIAEGWDNTIRKITPAGMVSTLAGLPAGYPPAEFSTNATDGVGSVARFNSPHSVAVDAAGTIYVADTLNNTIRKITPAGSVTTLAGMSPFQSFGSEDGPGALARFASPHGTAVDSTGNVYVADCYNHTIRKISNAGVVTTLAGTAGASGWVDGPGATARFYYPKGVAVDGAGTLYVADTGNETVRKITPAGMVTTLAGLPGVSGLSDGAGSLARFKGPIGVAVDAAGTLYVADTDNDTIRKITAAGVVTTLAGTAGASGSTDATGAFARFFAPEGIAVDGAGTVYVADTGNFIIRKVTPAGAVTTLAGLAGSSAWVDGAGSAARFYGPEGIAVDGKGMLYVVDNANYKISKYIKGGMLMLADGGSYTLRKITPAGLISAMADSPKGATEGNGPSSPVDWPGGNAAATSDTDPVVSTLAGETQGDADGIGKNAQFDLPRGISVDAKGTVYVSCSNLYSNTIRKGQLAGPPVITAQTVAVPAQVGANVELKVTATAVPAPTYQWYFNGAIFSGATTSTLVINNVRTPDAGNYTVVVTNELGSVTSQNATLTVTAAVPAPAPWSNLQKFGGGGAISPLGLAALGLLLFFRRWRAAV